VLLEPRPGAFAYSLYSIGTQTLNRLKDLALIETEDGLTYRLHD
jgi:hypothetical protein